MRGSISLFKRFDTTKIVETLSYRKKHFDITELLEKQSSSARSSIPEVHFLFPRAACHNVFGSFRGVKTSTTACELRAERGCDVTGGRGESCTMRRFSLLPVSHWLSISPNTFTCAHSSVIRVLNCIYTLDKRLFRSIGFYDNTKKSLCPSSVKYNWRGSFKAHIMTRAYFVIRGSSMLSVRFIPLSLVILNLKWPFYSVG